MTDHAHRPDPGREEAVAFLVERFNNARHTKPRTCLGCGGIGDDGTYDCYRGGPALHAWCSECYAEGFDGTVWEYRLSWDQFWRLLPNPVEGQIALELA